MRMLFGLVGLLVVVYIVMQLARTQLQALRPAPPAPPAASATAPPGTGTRTPQQQVVDDLNKALAIGQQRAASGVD